jgi:hypothetical protein
MVTGGKQSFSFLPQRRIRRARTMQKNRALHRREFERLLQHIAYLLPAFRSH